MTNKYRIVRFFQNGKPSRTIKTVSSLEIAQLHCNDPRTSKTGKWFDGYVKI